MAWDTALSSRYVLCDGEINSPQICGRRESKNAAWPIEYHLPCIFTGISGDMAVIMCRINGLLVPMSICYSYLKENMYLLDIDDSLRTF